jgi:hypothetical protein
MAESVSGQSSRRLIMLIAAEAAAIAGAVYLTLALDAGWVGVILLFALVAVFTVTIMRAGEAQARGRGAFSPAMKRYNQRMLAASAVYVVGLFGAIWAHDALNLPQVIAFAAALAPSLGVVMMVVAMARLIGEESDEYLRHRHIRAALYGLGGLLTIATIWGFFEQFDLVPHAPGWLAVPVFAIGLGVAHVWPRARS